MAGLDTTHVVRVFDVGVSDDGVPFLVMELVDGESLAQKLQREKKLHPGTAARLLGQADRLYHRPGVPAAILARARADAARIACAAPPASLGPGLSIDLGY